VGWHLWPAGVGPGPTPADTSGLPVQVPSLDVVGMASDLLQRLFVAAPALFILGAILAWRQDQRALLLRKSARVGSEENYRIPFDRSGLFRDALSRNAFLLLKRALRVRSPRLDIIKSIHGTIAAGGWPTLYHLHRWTNVELVIFVDRGKTRDHVGYLANILVDRLRAAQAFVTRYDYRFHPARVTLTSGRAEGPTSQDLPRVAHRHTDHRLILLTDAEGLFLTGTTTLDPVLRREFAHFGQVILLTPTPLEAWGEREQALTAAGMIVVPATAQGLDRASVLIAANPEDIVKAMNREAPEGYDPFLAQLERDYHRVTSDFSPPPEDIEDLVIQIYIWMGSRENFKVLAAVAAFPWIDPGLTLAFGSAILQRPVDSALFARLARLPWMRNARMPNWLRIAVVNQLSARDRGEVAERVTTVLSKAEARPEGNPLSVDECAALPIAQENRNFLGTVDPKALGALQERVFLSFLNGDRLDPIDPMALEATEVMKRSVGQRFARRQKVFAALALAVAAALFALKNPIAGACESLVMAVSQWVAQNLVPETEAPIWRWAAIAAQAAAIGSWAISAARRPEVLSGRKTSFSMRIKLLLFGLSAGFDWTAQRTWLALAIPGIVFAVLGIGDGGVSARILLVAGLLTLGWVLWVRLPAAGAATTLQIDYDDVKVCDSNNRCASKPGGLAEYPLGRAIAEDRWLKASFAVLAMLAPITFGVVVGTLIATVLGSASLVLLGAAISIAGWCLTLLLAKRLVLGSWRAPDRSWGQPLSPIGDLLFAAVGASQLIAAFRLVNEISGSSYALPLAATSLAVAGIVLCCVSIPLAGMRVRGKLIAYVSVIAIGLGLSLAVLIGVVVIAGGQIFLNSGFLFRTAVFTGFPVSLICMARAWRWWTHRRTPLDTDTRRILRRKKIIVTSVFLATSVLLISTALSQASSFIVFILCLYGVWIGPLYPLWRFIGPAAIDIELAKAEGRLSLSPAKTPESARDWWDTPWAALPAVALFGFQFTAPAVALSGVQFAPTFALLLAPLAMPIAVWFAIRHGAKALVPIALGTFPFWLEIHIAGVSTAGGVWPAIATVLWAKFASDAEFRARLLQRERLAWRDAVLLLLTLSITLNISAVLPVLGDAALVVEPTSMLLSLSIIVCAGRMPTGRLIVGLIIAAVIGRLIPVKSLHYSEVDAQIAVGIGFYTALAAIVCAIGFRIFRRFPLYRAGYFGKFLTPLAPALLAMLLGTFLGFMLAYPATNVLPSGPFTTSTAFIFACMGFVGGLSVTKISNEWRNFLYHGYFAVGSMGGVLAVQHLFPQFQNPAALFGTPLDLKEFGLSLPDFWIGSATYACYAGFAFLLRREPEPASADATTGSSENADVYGSELEAERPPEEERRSGTRPRKDKRKRAKDGMERIDGEEPKASTTKTKKTKSTKSRKKMKKRK
jgi:hypothetical protein